MGRSGRLWVVIVATLAVASAGGLLSAASAFGDDASVDAAYKQAIKRQAKKLGASTGRLLDGAITPSRVRKLVRNLRGAIVASIRAVRREHASTPTGRKARAGLLHGSKLELDALGDLYRSYIASLHGERRTAMRLERRGARLAKASGREVDHAEKLFRVLRKRPPDTKITNDPSGTTSGPTPTFEFTATKTKSTFQCQLDGAPLAVHPGRAAHPRGPHIHRPRHRSVRSRRSQPGFGGVHRCSDRVGRHKAAAWHDDRGGDRSRDAGLTRDPFGR